MAQLLAPPKKRYSKKKQRSTNEYGYEHEVQPGESLSEIAKAYQAKIKVIIDANDLENPDRLRVGQKLFIPE
ncbi:MAG: LysM peptidoglycan-binding domain-containing protein [Kiritimatiellae bacterium]|nr:LysM peptidoglycan-binding domain-containing protein [Kiritimatiellia bacterium]